ncbi:DUF1774-domain-containing protein [Lojkania enalia]|uniref:DUF1774-domain-containing protein n=1 Tax=Lojkania enalia TaxID=147567 RepID=A0A9P4K757_9PLEO|nr:DUF1774-domain-containing protein [Didymosphaeria enalia]
MLTHCPVNPFSRRDEYSKEAILFYKVGTFASYLVLLVTAIYYDIHAPGEGRKPRHTIWKQNALHQTPFTQNAVVTSVYWLALFLLQLTYTYHLYSTVPSVLTAAAAVGSHAIASNLLLFGFLHLWTRSHFFLSLLLLIVNFFNLSLAYFRHPTTPRLVHVSVVSGPLAWNFVALYWVGAVVVGAKHLPARIVANVFIWGFLGYGVFFLAVYKDYTIGLAMAIMSLSTALAQLQDGGPLNLQWIFAITIFALLMLLSLAVGLPSLFHWEPFSRGEVVDEDRERAPLLRDE